ncbi:MAG: hydrogenase maturation protease [Chloroflexia bacterium]
MSDPGTPRILVACIGNIFLGDDAFGVEVARVLAQRQLPEGVRVTDFGIRGFDLAYALMDDYDASILVDALPRGDAPGTLYVIEPDMNNLGKLEGAAIDTHAMHPLRVLTLVKTLGGEPGRVLVLGCEPTPLDPDDEEIGLMGLSEPVQLAVGEAVRMIEGLIEKLSHEVART